MQEGGFKIFLCGPRDGKVFLISLDLLRAAKKNVPWNWGVGLCGIRGRRLIFSFSERGAEGCVASLSSIKIFTTSISILSK